MAESNFQELDLSALDERARDIDCDTIRAIGGAWLGRPVALLPIDIGIGQASFYRIPADYGSFWRMRLGLSAGEEEGTHLATEDLAIIPGPSHIEDNPNEQGRP
jgi:hypothetical protein